MPTAPQATPTPENPALSHHVSLFASALATDPTETIPISEILAKIKSGTWSTQVDALRKTLDAQNEKAYTEAKRYLPAITMSAACFTRDSKVPIEKRILSHSGILQCDFDKKDNPHMLLNETTWKLKRDPHVLFGFRSPSDKGLKAGLLIDGTRHAESFLSAEKYFLDKYGLQIDRTTKDPLRLCFVSSDPKAFINHTATPLPVVAIVKKAAPVTWHPPIESTAADLEEMLKFIPSRPPYDDWLRIASAVWSVLGFDEGTRILNQWSPEEKDGEYDHKHRNRLKQIGVGTLVHYAAQNGFDAKAAARRKQWAGRVRFAQTHIGELAADAGAHDPAAEVRPVELSREKVLEYFQGAQHGDALLWCALVKGQKLFDHLAMTWRTYRGGIWERDDTAQTIIQASAQLAGAYLDFQKTILLEIAKNPAPENTKDPREKIVADIELRRKQLQTAPYIEHVLSFAKSHLATKAILFDKEPGLLCVKNGVVDFRNGIFREHSPSDMITVRTEVHFDPEALAPRWTAFMLFAMNNNVEMVDYLARAIGYSLTGYVDKDLLFFLYGKGANGKSTFAAIIKMLAGEFMTTMSIVALLAQVADANHDYKKAMLEGKRIVITDEIPENKTLNDSAVKALVGGDEITARRPYEKPYVFAPTHKLWLVGNHKPTVKGVDLGIWRRIHLIPWTNTIPEEMRRPRHELIAELQAELPGILLWAIRGYMDMVDNGGLRPPAEVTNATREYQHGSDQFAGFAEDRLEAGADYRCDVADVWHGYMAWCADNGEHPRYASTRLLIAHCKDKGITIATGAGRKRIIEGFRLRPAAE